MRNIPSLSLALLERATMNARKAPTFRFHGSTAPSAKQRQPVLNATPSGSSKDGVATLRLYAPIDSWGGPWGVSALEFIEALDSLDESVSEIRLHINSPGGEVWEALAILNTLRAHPARLVAVVDGIAASAASFIACAADETIMGKNSQMMIHDALGICIGNASDMHALGDLLGSISDNIASIYADKSGASVADVRADMLAETWYSADEAVAAGLADSVAGVDPEPVDAFDVKGAVGAKYGNRAEVPEPVAREVPDPSDDIETRTRRHRMNARKLAGI